MSTIFPRNGLATCVFRWYHTSLNIINQQNQGIAQPLCLSGKFLETIFNFDFFYYLPLRSLHFINNIICINNEQMTIYCIIYLPLGIKPRDDKPRVGGEVSASSSRGERTVGRGWTGLGKLSSVIPCSSSI